MIVIHWPISFLNPSRPISIPLEIKRPINCETFCKMKLLVQYCKFTFDLNPIDFRFINPILHSCQVQSETAFAMSRLVQLRDNFVPLLSLDRPEMVGADIGTRTGQMKRKRRGGWRGLSSYIFDRTMRYRYLYSLSPTLYTRIRVQSICLASYSMGNQFGHTCVEGGSI